jgi:murein L,D-transpeptidase YcbB/YkuD
MIAVHKIRIGFLTSIIIYGLLACFSFAQASNEEVGSFIKQAFDAKKIKTGSPHLNQRMEELESFYASRSFKPIWVRDNGPKGKAKALLLELNRSIVHGLEPSFYRTDELSKMMASSDPDELARLEMLFSGALIDYGYDLSNGHIDYQKAPEHVQIKPIIRSITDVIDGAEQAGDLREFVSSLLNVDDRYVRLLAKIAEMKRALSAGLWPNIPANIPELELGQSHPEIINIRTHLVLMGDFLLAEIAERAEFDEPLRQAIISYQSRLGLTMTGQLDRTTLDEISVPIEETIEKISINLERRRWQNREIGKKHVYVNLSDGQARLVIDDEKAEEFELLRQDTDTEIPTLYGTITEVSLPASNEGLQLTVLQEAPDGGKPQTYSLTLDGDADELATLIKGAPVQLSNGNVQKLDLPEPVNIFITYVTAWANKDGTVHFRPDQYGRDIDLEKRLRAN